MKDFIIMAVDKVRERRWATALLMLLLVGSIATTLLVSCAQTAPSYPAGVAVEVQQDRMRVERYIELMKQGKTTRTQDQQMIESCFRVFQSLETVMTKDDKE